MHNTDAWDLALVRLEKAKSEYESAELLLNADKYEASVNRSYYAMFHAVRAILALDRVDFRKHTGVLSYYREHYIKTDKLPNVTSDYLKKAFGIRQESDYEDYAVIAKVDAEDQLNNANHFVEIIETYLISLQQNNN